MYFFLHIFILKKFVSSKQHRSLSNLGDKVFIQLKFRGERERGFSS